MPKPRKKVRELMVFGRISQEQAELVENHPHAELVVRYALSKRITVQRALQDNSSLWRIDGKLSWGVTAYEAWRLACVGRKFNEVQIEQVEQ